MIFKQERMLTALWCLAIISSNFPPLLPDFGNKYVKTSASQYLIEGELEI